MSIQQRQPNSVNPAESVQQHCRERADLRESDACISRPRHGVEAVDVQAGDAPTGDHGRGQRGGELVELSRVPAELLQAPTEPGGVTEGDAVEAGAKMELSGACAYAGGTDVSGGTLIVSGSLADSSMAISGGTVNGTGTLTFNVAGGTSGTP